MIALFDGVSFDCSLGKGVTNDMLKSIKRTMEGLSDYASVSVQEYEGEFSINASASPFKDDWTKKHYDTVAEKICDIMGIDEVKVRPQRGNFDFLEDNLPENEQRYIYQKAVS